jgi:hypothetical protein
MQKEIKFISIATQVDFPNICTREKKKHKKKQQF